MRAPVPPGGPTAFSTARVIRTPVTAVRGRRPGPLDDSGVDLFPAFPQQGRRDSNPQPPVLETGALPIELLPYTLLSGQGGSRTPDTAIFSRMLYQLSYLAAPYPYDTSRSNKKPPGFGGRVRL